VDVSDLEAGDVESWFAARGFLVRISDTDYSDRLPRNALSKTHHVWADLLSTGGRVIHPAYGSGESASAALHRARQRYRQEQGE
jgi:hypothetical protein